ncbi:hypothetical protein ACTQZS_08120 [Bilifractor sp. LCP19S3_H10]|uniref:hypothetical protein n=1 Tax=Bilifractor sp. LCP19S3_H10 TaxID=3438736 RepID=UPI003F915CBE
MKHNYNYPIIVGKGFKKRAVCGISHFGSKCMCIVRENDAVETCICFTDDDSIRHMIDALEILLETKK